MIGDLFLQAKHAQGGAALASAVERGSQHVDHYLLGERRRIDDHCVHPAGFGDQRRRAALGSRRLAILRCSRVATSVEPVNITPRTRSSEVSAAPTVSPRPGSS